MPIRNRSSHFVAVNSKDALSRTFTHDRFDEAVACANSLHATPPPSGIGKYQPATGQLEKSFLLRFRDNGCLPFGKTFSSKDEAELEQQLRVRARQARLRLPSLQVSSTN